NSSLNELPNPNNEMNDQDFDIKNAYASVDLSSGSRKTKRFSPTPVDGKQLKSSTSILKLKKEKKIENKNEIYNEKKSTPVNSQNSWEKKPEKQQKENTKRNEETSKIDKSKKPIKTKKQEKSEKKMKTKFHNFELKLLSCKKLSSICRRLFKHQQEYEQQQEEEEQTSDVDYEDLIGTINSGAKCILCRRDLHAKQHSFNNQQDKFQIAGYESCWVEISCPGQKKSIMFCSFYRNNNLNILNSELLMSRFAQPPKPPDHSEEMDGHYEYVEDVIASAIEKQK
ncbi:hypothetical protein RFI_22318, partial [Reticulomyxa filosa]